MSHGAQRETPLFAAFHTSHPAPAATSCERGHQGIKVLEMLGEVLGGGGGGGGGGGSHRGLGLQAGAAGYGEAVGEGAAAAAGQAVQPPARLRPGF